MTSIICAGVFDAQPTASERQRENLSSRLRREFGLALPEDDDARPPTDPSGTTHESQETPFGRLDAQLVQPNLTLGTWAPNVTSHSAEAWPEAGARLAHGTHSLDGASFARAKPAAAGTSLPGCDNLVLLGETAHNLASLDPLDPLDTCRGNLSAEQRRDSPNAAYVSGRTFQWGRRGV